jgi:Na+-transporting methylmalonyl-CoA/oxaloacetate decarboxylase gamma subunit
MQFVPLLVQAIPTVQEPALRGLAAIEATNGWWVAVVGMCVVFSALFSLFLIMKALIRFLEPRPAPQLSAAQRAAIEQAPESAVEVPSAGDLSPQVVAAIATAIRLERQRLASAAPAPQPGAVSGWVVSRSLQWAAHQSIFQRSRS